MKFKTPHSCVFIFLLSFIWGFSNCKSPVDNKTDFKKGSGITSINLTPQKIEDLSVLGKVWGFLKYYHPEVAKGKYNWDYELFKILPGIIACKDEKERNDILASWVESLGEVEKDSANYIDSSMVRSYPDLDWISDKKTLGDDLTEELIEVKEAKRTGKNYYVKLAYLGANNPIFTNEDSCKQFLYPDAGYRLLCLFRYWNCIEYFSPNKHLIGEDWDNVLKAYIPKFLEAKNELDYKIIVSDLIGAIHDTHANVMCNDSTWMNYIGRYLSLVKTEFIENKIVVTDFYNKEYGEKSGLKIGDIISDINGKSIEEISKEWMPHTHASNYPTAMRNIAWNIFRGNDSILDITYRRGTEVNTVRLKCFLEDNIIDIIKGAWKLDTCFKIIFPGISYFFPGSFKEAYLKNVMPEILKTKGLVIDFRCYPSDNILTSFVHSFFLRPVRYLKTSSGDINFPGLFKYDYTFRVGIHNPKHYQGKVVVLVNEMTQSQAEWDVMALQAIPNAVVIGSTTAGADGNISLINLIGGISTYISGRGVYYPDGRETQRIGIVPDIEIHPTIQGIREGRDELLEKAIEIINQ